MATNAEVLAHFSTPKPIGEIRAALTAYSQPAVGNRSQMLSNLRAHVASQNLLATSPWTPPGAPVAPVVPPVQPAPVVPPVNNPVVPPVQPAPVATQQMPQTQGNPQQTQQMQQPPATYSPTNPNPGTVVNHSDNNRGNNLVWPLVALGIAFMVCLALFFGLKSLKSTASASSASGSSAQVPNNTSTTVPATTPTTAGSTNTTVGNTATTVAGTQASIPPGFIVPPAGPITGAQSAMPERVVACKTTPAAIKIDCPVDVPAGSAVVIEGNVVDGLGKGVVYCRYGPFKATVAITDGQATYVSKANGPTQAKEVLNKLMVNGWDRDVVDLTCK